MNIYTVSTLNSTHQVSNFAIMSNINSLVISKIHYQYTSEYIANVFWNQNIAQVSTITLLPYIQGIEVFQRAYITIAAWCDSEVAYNLIQRLRDPSKKCRIVHLDELWWPVKINTQIAGYYYLDHYTTVFPETYFKRPEAPEAPAAAKPANKVIPAYRGDHKYTVIEALRRCEQLGLAITEAEASGRPSPAEIAIISDSWEELGYLEDQLRDYGSKQDEADENEVTESLTKHFGIRDSGKVNVDYVNQRLSFLRTIMPKYPLQDPLALQVMQNIKSEIEHLEVQLFSFFAQNSQNVTLRPHQQSLVL